MATPLPPILPGDPITADRLNVYGDAANKLNAVLAAPGAGPGQRLGNHWVSACVVISRSITPADLQPDGSAPLHAIEYTLTVPQRRAFAVTATWRERICRVQPSLIGPDRTDNQLFWPAAVVGTPEADREPWRAHGTLYMTGYTETDGTPRFFVELFGEMPFRGC